VTKRAGDQTLHTAGVAVYRHFVCCFNPVCLYAYGHHRTPQDSVNSQQDGINSLPTQETHQY